MKHISYSCNVCGSTHPPEKLYGLRWGWDRTRPIEQLELHDAYSCEQHWCHTCYDEIKRLVKEKK